MIRHRLIFRAFSLLLALLILLAVPMSGASALADSKATKINLVTKKLTLRDGSTYEGQTYKNEPYGFGVKTSKDTVYYGLFTAGKFDHFGFLYSPNGKKASYFGQWKDGKKHGTGQVYALNGNCLRTTFANDLANGSGHIYYPDGTYRMVIYKNGELTYKGGRFSREYECYFVRRAESAKAFSILTQESYYPNGMHKLASGDYYIGDYEYSSSSSGSRTLRPWLRGLYYTAKTGEWYYGRWTGGKRNDSDALAYRNGSLGRFEFSGDKYVGTGSSENPSPTQPPGQSFCIPCDGTGKARHTACSGNGYTYEYVRSPLSGLWVLEKIRCSSCGGTGKVTCGYCLGRGYK